MNFAALSAPFPPDRVSWRVGSTTQDKAKGMALAFIDARDVMIRLDAVCGPAKWQRRYPHADKKTVFEIGIKCGDDWVWKADGAGDSDIEAEKGALSDAFKRAAVSWGIGRYLYDLESPWVELEQRGRTAVIKASEHAKLRNLLTRNAQASAPAQSRVETVKPTAKERAAAFLATARACEDVPRLDKLARSADAASLRRDLERSDPELGEEVAAEIGKLFDTLPETAPARSDAETVFA